MPVSLIRARGNGRESEVQRFDPHSDGLLQ